MNDFDEKTQQWLLRTQEIRRTPALRGGVSPDHRARRETIASVAAVLAVLLMLIAVPSRLQNTPPRRAATAMPTREDVTVGVYAPSRRLVSTSQPPAPPLPSPTYLPAPTAFIRPEILLPPPGHVAPPAPIWLDGPAGNQDFQPQNLNGLSYRVP